MNSSNRVPQTSSYMLASHHLPVQPKARSHSDIGAWPSKSLVHPAPPTQLCLGIRWLGGPMPAVQMASPDLACEHGIGIAWMVLCSGTSEA